MLTLFYAKRGTPDLEAANAVTAMLPKGSVTCDLAEAKRAMEAGATVYAVGGPASRDLPSAKPLVGDTGIDTLMELAQFAKGGYK